MSVKAHIECDRCGAATDTTTSRWASAGAEGWGDMAFDLGTKGENDLLYDLCPDCLPMVVEVVKAVVAGGKDTMTSGVLVDVDLDSLP